MELQLDTERLRLTPLTQSDVDISIEMFTDPEVALYVCDLMTETQIRNEMPNWTKRGGNGCIGIWCVTDRKTGEKLGSGLLLPMPVDNDDTDYSLIVMGQIPDAEIEIGFCLKQSAWGRGYATEICRRLLQLAFQETSLGEVVATFEDENVASKKVLEKCGFVHRGRMRSYGQDSPNYRITRDEWNELQEPT